MIIIWRCFLALKKGGERLKLYRERSFSFRTEAVSHEGETEREKRSGMRHRLCLESSTVFEMGRKPCKCGKMTSPCKIRELGTWVSLAPFLCFSDWLTHCTIKILLVTPKVLYQKSVLFDPALLLLETNPKGGTKGVPGWWTRSHENTLAGISHVFSECSSLCDWGNWFLSFVFSRFSTTNTCCLL